MDRTRTSREQKEFSPKKQHLVIKKNAEIREHNPLAYILDENNIARGILECLKNNDPEGVMEIIEIYLGALNKAQFLKEAHVPRSTMYNLFKNRNPTVKTLAKIVHASTEIHSGKAAK